MVLVQRRRQHHLVFALALLAGCGGSPEVVVAVSMPEQSSALTGVTQIDLSVTHGGHRIAFQSTPYKSGDDLSFDKIPHEDGLVIGVVGRNSNSDPLAYGSVTLGNLGSGTCCVTLCLCTTALQSQGGCNCGSGECGSCTATDTKSDATTPPPSP